MSDDLVKRLRDTPNWMREGFQDWKDNVRTYDRAPFEAADRIEALERAVRYLAQQGLDEREELEAKLAKAVRFLNGLDRHGVYTTDELEDLLEELKGGDG